MLQTRAIKLLAGRVDFCVPWGDSGTQCSYQPIDWKLGNSSLGEIIGQLMPYIFSIAGIILLVMIIFSGYSLLTSAGNPEGIEKGKKRLTASLTGFAIVFATFWIWQLISLFISGNLSFTLP